MPVTPRCRHAVRGARAVTLLAPLLGALALFTGCGRTETPEQAIRALFTRTAAAVQEGDVDGAVEALSASYRDARGHDRTAAGQLLRLRLRMHGAIYLLWKARTIEVDGPSAHATVVVAAAARPIDAASFREVDADLLRFQVALREEGGAWRITSADWEPASLSDWL